METSGGFERSEHEKVHAIRGILRDIPLTFNFEARNHRVLLSKYYCSVDRPRRLKLWNRLTNIYTYTWFIFTTFDFVIHKYQIRTLLYSVNL